MKNDNNNLDDRARLFQEDKDYKNNLLVPLKGSVTSGSKLQVNTRENINKSEAFKRIKNFKYRTSPKAIAHCLEIIFGVWEDMPEHWLYLSQNYTPKAINSVFSEMKKMKERGERNLHTPGRLFTYLLTSFHPPRRHPKRKVYRTDVVRDIYGRYKKRIFKKESEI